MLTMQGALVGSPYYMSPEQVVAEADLDIRCDLYALGAVLYYLLCGQDPYRGGLNEVLHAHRSAPVPDAMQVRPDLHPATAAIIQRAMQKKREDRFPDPAAMRQAVAAALAGLGATAAADPAPRETYEANTVAADLSGGDDGSDSVPTISMPQSDTEATAAAPATTPAATAITARIEQPAITVDLPPAPRPVVPVPRPPPDAGASVDGDLDAAIANPWLALLQADGTPILLYARTQILLGKLCEPPVDLCLRKYPVMQWRDDCLKISRQHLRLRYDAGLSRPLLTDLGGSNGTLLDGQRLAPNQTLPLEPGRAHRCTVAGVLDLTLTAIRRTQPPITSLRGAGSEAGQHDCGLDRDLLVDAVVIARPDNRPGMASALVLRRLGVGGAGADLPVAGASRCVELAVFRGRWLHRLQAGEPWRPLIEGARVDLGGCTVAVGPGCYQLFQDG
jgi:hypothetical protein